LKTNSSVSPQLILTVTVLMQWNQLQVYLVKRGINLHSLSSFTKVKVSLNCHWIKESNGLLMEFNIKLDCYDQF